MPQLHSTAFLERSVETLLTDLTLLMLNKLRCHAHFKFPANQIT